MGPSKGNWKREKMTWSSVIRAEGESLGQLDLIVQLTKLDNMSTRKLEDKISAHRCPMLVLKGYKPCLAVRLCLTQQMMGEFFIWEYPPSNDCQTVNDEMPSMVAHKLTGRSGEFD